MSYNMLAIKKIKVYAKLSILIPLLVWAGCSPHFYKTNSLATMRNLPLEEGEARAFAADLAAVKNAGSNAIAELDMRIADDMRINDSTWAIFAERDYSFWKGVGEVLRLTVSQRDKYYVEVRVASERKLIFFFIASPDNSDDIFASVEQALTASDQLMSADEVARKIELDRRRKKHLAVFPLTSGYLSPHETMTLTNRLTTEIFMTDIFIVLEQEKVREILAEQNFQQTGCTTSECLVEAGKLLKVEQIIGGQITKHEGDYLIRIYLIDVRSKKAIKTASVQVRGPISALLTQGIPEAARQLVL